MDMSKWQQYETKKKELRKSFLKQRITAWIIWLVIAVAINTVILLFQKKMGMQITFMVMLITNAFSLFIICRKNAELKHHLKRQLDMIEQDEPFGKFNT